VKTEDRQRKQIEEYNARLREQELQDWEHKLQVQQRLERSGRAGTAAGNAIIGPTGQIIQPMWNAEGTQQSLASQGSVPWADTLVQQAEAEARADAADAAWKESRIGFEERKTRATESKAGAAWHRATRPDSGSSLAPPIMSVADQIAAEKAGAAKAARDLGLKADEDTGAYTIDGNTPSPEVMQRFQQKATEYASAYEPRRVGSASAPKLSDEAQIAIARVNASSLPPEAKAAAIAEITQAASR